MNFPRTIFENQKRKKSKSFLMNHSNMRYNITFHVYTVICKILKCLYSKSERNVLGILPLLFVSGSFVSTIYTCLWVLPLKRWRKLIVRRGNFYCQINGTSTWEIKTFVPQSYRLFCFFAIKFFYSYRLLIYVRRCE